MVWISEIESAKSTADLQTSYTITAAKLQTNFEVLVSEIASDPKIIINGDFKSRVFIQEDAAQEGNAFSREGKSRGWFMSISISATQTNPSWNSTRFGRSSCRDDKVHPLNTRWDETIITMKKQADDEILDDSFHRQLQQLEQLHLLSLYIQDTVQKGESRDYTRLKTYGGPMHRRDES